MANRPILDIEVNDSEFTEFLRKWEDYKTQVVAMPQTWMAINYEIGNLKTRFEKILDGLEGINRKTGEAADSQSKAAKIFDATELTLVGIGTSGKHFAHNIHQSTQSLMKWTKLTAVFSGILGAGGLFGIDRMAAGVAGRRGAAAGLGVSIGEQSSFNATFARLGNPEGILSGFSQGLSTSLGRAQIAHLLGHQPTGDAAETAAEALPKFKEFITNTPKDMWQKRLEALGYSNLGLGVEQANIVSKMSPEEVAKTSQAYRTKKTGLDLDPDTARKWTDFQQQMDFAGREIEKVLATNFKQLVPGLEHLSDSFVHLVDNVLKDGSPLKGWIDKAGEEIKKFSDAIGEKSFLAGAERISRDATAIIRVVEKLTASSLKDAIATAYRGIYGGLKNGMDSSRADITQRYGKNWHWYSGFTGSNSPSSSSSTPPSSAPGATGPGYGTHGTPTNQTTGPRRDRGTSPATMSGGGTSSSSSSPILGDATHHPEKYIGTISVDGQLFDYASGGHGRGSSPFGDHPITGFDPTALHGRGGGAFRTKDIYDPQTGDKRGAVEIHMSNQDDISRVETAGCYGIPRSEWPAAKAAIQRFLANHPEGATLRVRPDGRAEIVSRADKVSSAPVSSGIKGQDPADVAAKMVGVHDTTPHERDLLKRFMDGRVNGMDPHDYNWCASFVAASVSKAGLPLPKGADVALNWRNYGTAIKPKDVRKGDIMVAGTQYKSGHVGIVTGPDVGGKIPIIEGDYRDDETSYKTSPGSVYSKTKTGPSYMGGHHVSRGSAGESDEGTIFRRPPGVGTHPADIVKGQPTGINVNNAAGNSVSVDVSH